MKVKHRRRAERGQRIGVRQQRAGHGHDRAERARRRGGVLRAPPAERKLGGDRAALREPEEVDALGRPRAVLDQVGQHAREQVERRRRVRVWEELAEQIEGLEPLKRGLAEVRDPVRAASAQGSGARRGRAVRTYCIGARRASVAVCGSFSWRASAANGWWVSPGRIFR